MGNQIKEKIQEGNVPFGCFIGIYSPALTEIIGYAGFDFVVIDNEHGSFSWGQVEEMIKSCELSDVTPFVRVPDSNPINILKALDRGAKGIHVPQVSTAKEAERIVRAAKYPPEGNRGAAYSVRAAKYGMAGGNDYLKKSNEDVFIAVHVENPAAIDEVEGIMRSGIDMTYIGPTDLSVSAGQAAEGPSHPEVQNMMEKIKDVGKHLNANIGIQVASLQEFKERKSWGATYMGIAINSIINPALKKIVDKANEGNFIEN